MWTRSAAVTSLLLAGLGCSPDKVAPMEPSAAIVIRSFAFLPSTIRIGPGTPVTFTNRDRIAHTVTSGRAGDRGVPGVSAGRAAEPDGRFDEALPAAGDRAIVMLAEAGSYPYFCAIHAGMAGKITVLPNIR